MNDAENTLASYFTADEFRDNAEPSATVRRIFRNRVAMCRPYRGYLNAFD
ncbi:MAG: hypothetical protein M1488_02290 [Gammaproteobacteria bacterium]|nr:hypothetical protein [Gammaproteobacteria bacterium]